MRSISADLEGLPDACLLEPAEELIHPLPVPPLLEDQPDDTDDAVQEYTWDPLPLRFTLRDSNGKTLEVIDQMEWLPSPIEQFALFWFLAAAPDSPALDMAGTLLITQPADGDDWRTPLAYREAGLDGLALDPAHRSEDNSPLLDELLTLRHELRDAFQKVGLDTGRIQSFLDAWQSLLRQAREHFVPDGTRSKELDAFLGTDLVAIAGSERRLMLPCTRYACGGYVDIWSRQGDSLTNSFLVQPVFLTERAISISTG